jgi:hypothetical protein
LKNSWQKDRSIMMEVKVENKIYVQSSGFSNQHDYDWQCCDSDIDVFSRPPYQNIPGLKQAELNSFCLVLSRSSNGLFLLVSGLPSGRKDIRHRDIRNMVMWSIDQPDDKDEAIFRNLAALALRDHCGGSILTDQINKAIEASNDNKYGYTVSFDLLGLEKLKGVENKLSSNHSSELKSKELSYSQQNIENLAREIENSSLPIGTKNLIVVTDNRTQVIVDETNLYLRLGDVVCEPSTVVTVNSTVEQDSSIFSQLLTSINSIIKIDPKLALVAIIGLIGILLSNLPTESQSLQILDLKKLEAVTLFERNQPTQVVYTLTGTYNSQVIEKVKLIDIKKELITVGNIESNQNWKIIHKSKSALNCQTELFVQGFDKEGKEVGNSTKIPSIWNGAQLK